LKIYVVRPGDTVWTLSKRFGVSFQSILNANGLDASETLVIGQSLIIPSTEKSYIVRPGDSIWSIARDFGVSPNTIISMNGNLSPNALYPGRVILIPEKSKNYGYIEVNGFIQPSTPEKERRVLGESIQYLTYVTPFSQHVNADASLTPLDDTTILQIAKGSLVAPMLSVTNISGANFDTALIDSIMNNNGLQQTLINNILALLKGKGYYGVIIDFEKISPENRNKYNDFLRKVVAALHPNYIVATALAPKTYDVTTGAWHGAHDYKAHGQIVDFVVIMTYEWGWSGGPPMAVAPLDQVKLVINYALSVMPASKIMMGMALYGYDWTLPYTPGGEFAESIGNQEAIDRARKYGAEIKYDNKAESPYYNYIDEKGRSHVVWFEDARSVAAKYKFVSQEGLRGVSYWVLAQPFPQNWQVLDDMFNIVKVIK
jgi:spore germination protein